MTGSRFRGDNVYRLVLGQDGVGEPRMIEFEAAGSHFALMLAEQHCAGRVTEILENGRSLGSVQNVAGGGYWVLTSAKPPRACVLENPASSAPWAKRAL